jgi:hypothetical protein
LVPNLKLPPFLLPGRERIMAADYQAIVDAIDAAITSWVDKPVTLSIAGRSLTYRSLKDLIDARSLYAKLAIASRVGRGYTITNLKAGDGK